MPGSTAALLLLRCSAHVSQVLLRVLLLVAAGEAGGWPPCWHMRAVDLHGQGHAAESQLRNMKQQSTETEDVSGGVQIACQVEDDGTSAVSELLLASTLYHSKVLLPSFATQGREAYPTQEVLAA